MRQYLYIIIYALLTALVTACSQDELDVPSIKLCMADHENYPKALCRHPADPSVRLAKRSITVASEIYDFEAGEAHICAGPPCQGEYITYRL